jgi:hypothetical protein
MRIKPYPVIRDLHLYLGLFISPFVVVFSLSAIFIAHAFIPKFGPDSSKTRVVSDLSIPSTLTNLIGRPQVDALRPILESIAVPGEIGFVQYSSAGQQWIIPVTVPGRETTVTLSLPKKEATIVVRDGSLASTLITLHKSPGQHGATIRMNWFFMKVWRWLADATVYLVLFISISGIYLWYVLRAERRIGFILLFAGAVSFFGIAYAISH